MDDRNFSLPELLAQVGAYNREHYPVNLKQRKKMSYPRDKGLSAMTAAAAYMEGKMKNGGAFAGDKRHNDPEDKACICGAKICHPDCACSKSRLFLDVAKDLKVSPAKLYNLLHKERVLFRLRGQVRNSEEKKHFGFAVTYADFTGTNLFERETVADANGFTSCRLRVFPKGISFIKALISNAAPDAKEIYRTVFPGETI